MASVLQKKDIQSLGNDEIDAVFRQSKCIRFSRILETSPKNNIPDLYPGDMVVVNIQSDMDEQGNPLPGKHWVCCGKISNHSAWYFDSFGLAPPKQVIQALHVPLKKIKYAENQIQDNDSGTCGWFCILACTMFDRCRGNMKKISDTFYKITQLFDSPNLETNDDILFDCLNHTL